MLGVRNCNTDVPYFLVKRDSAFGLTKEYVYIITDDRVNEARNALFGKQ
jgi:hypothetical protein